jgi:hypothetical protein
MEKISPLHHVSDATVVIAAGCHGCGGTILVDYVHCIRWVAFQLTRKGLPVTTAPLAVEIPLIAS